MPIIKSAIKRARQTTKRTERNTRVKRELRAITKDVDAALAKKSKDLPELISRLYSELDRSVKKNLIHRNKAARLKSQYSAKARAAGASMAVAKKAKKSTAKTAGKTAAKKTATAKTKKSSPKKK